MGLKEKLERELGISVPIRAGAPGSLRVLVDGDEIYSKQRSGGGPANPSAIVDSIRAKLP